MVVVVAKTPMLDDSRVEKRREVSWRGFEGLIYLLNRSLIVFYISEVITSNNGGCGG